MPSEATDTAPAAVVATDTPGHTATRRCPPRSGAQDLLARMTLDEKLAQLGALWSFEVFDGRGLDRERARERLRDGIGQVTRVAGATNLPPREVAAFGDQIQRFLVEETRLGIPAIIHEECLHGVMARDATCFAQSIGQAATWDPELVERVARRLGAHLRATGASQGLAPVLDIARDAALGTPRGDLRRGSVPGGSPRLCLRLGHPGHARRRAAGHRDRQAHGRLCHVGGRPQPGAPASRCPRACRYLPLPLRGSRASGGPRLDHACLRRARRGALRRVARAADDHPARALGLRRASWSPTTSASSTS